jgi:hypothetical protein
MPVPVKIWKRLACVSVLILLSAGAAMAQISYKAVEHHNQQKRQSLKEAKQAEVEYKDTHLNTSTYTFKKGAPGRKRVAARDGRNKYRFTDSGNAAQGLPVKIKKGWLFKRKKNITQK